MHAAQLPLAATISLLNFTLSEVHSLLLLDLITPIQHLTELFDSHLPKTMVPSHFSVTKQSKLLLQTIKLVFTNNYHKYFKFCKYLSKRWHLQINLQHKMWVITDKIPRRADIYRYLKSLCKSYRHCTCRISFNIADVMIFMQEQMDTPEWCCVPLQPCTGAKADVGWFIIPHPY